MDIVTLAIVDEDGPFNEDYFNQVYNFFVRESQWHMKSIDIAMRKPNANL